LDVYGVCRGKEIESIWCQTCMRVRAAAMMGTSGVPGCCWLSWLRRWVTHKRGDAVGATRTVKMAPAYAAGSQLSWLLLVTALLTTGRSCRTVVGAVYFVHDETVWRWLRRGTPPFCGAGERRCQRQLWCSHRCCCRRCRLRLARTQACMSAYAPPLPRRSAFGRACQAPTGKLG